jgi:hypothetical protein
LTLAYDEIEDGYLDRLEQSRRLAGDALLPVEAMGGLPTPDSLAPSPCSECDSEFPTCTGIILCEPFNKADLRGDAVNLEYRLCWECAQHLLGEHLIAQLEAGKDCPHATDDPDRFWFLVSGRRGVEDCCFLCDGCVDTFQ